MSGLSDSKRALDRTVLLIRDHLEATVRDREILEVLTKCRVGVTADSLAASTSSGQIAISTFSLLCARFGARVELYLPDSESVGVTAPLVGMNFRDALEEILGDLITPVVRLATDNTALDLLAVVGNPPRLPDATRRIWLAAEDWQGEQSDEPIPSDWSTQLPFGALASAGLAAAEAFKLVMQRLAKGAQDRRLYDDYFAPIWKGYVSLAPRGTTLRSANLGRIDMISAGAITQSAIYALSRIPQVDADIRMYEPERSEESNLNRYAFLRHSQLGEYKVRSLAALSESGKLGNLRIEPLVLRYENTSSNQVGAFAESVLVGVDHIPTRWEVQRQFPEILAVGATSHYDAMVSLHRPNDKGCAGCVHPVDDDNNGTIPTLSIVSHWAGLLLASQFVRAKTGTDLLPAEQLIYSSPLQIGNPSGIWRSNVAENPRCPVTEFHSAFGRQARGSYQAYSGD